jgi:FkbM family methyltransferase
VDQSLHQFLGQTGQHPVLMDIGASGGAPGIWETLALHSFHVAFDPDLRETKEEKDGAWYRSTTINEAVHPDPSSDSVQFNLTRSPYCCSTLLPDKQLLGNFLESERFDVLKQVSCKATTVDAVLKRLSLDHIDWLKLDTQGTDLRIYQSMSQNVKTKVLAIDIEPGLRGAYIDEDLFGDVHTVLRRDGFFLCNAKVKGMIRLRPTGLEAIKQSAPDLTIVDVERAVRIVPGWIELRYFRSLESMTANQATAGEFKLLWLFAMLDNQLGFALDTALEFGKLFNSDPQAEFMRSEPIRRIRTISQQQKDRERLAKSSLPYRGLRKIAGKIRRGLNR